MGTKTFRTPITIHDGNQYCAPGTEVTLDEREANRIIGLHGEFGAPVGVNDPGNTNVLNAMDHKSIADLNTFASINGGHGKQAGRDKEFDTSDASGKDPLPGDHELDRMNRPALVELAKSRGIEVTDETRAEIVAKIKASA